MKKYLTLLFLLTILAACDDPERRSWIVPVKIDPSDLTYTPGESDCFEKRRAKAMDLTDGGILVLYATDQRSENRHEYQPNNYFYYLSGVEVPYSALLLDPSSTEPFTIILPEESPRSLVYQGANPSPEEVAELYGAHRVLHMMEGQALIDSLVLSGRKVFTDPGNRYAPELEGAEDVRPLLDQLRVIKDRCEVERLQQACNITAKALTRVMLQCTPGQYEFEMESIIEGTFLEYGSAIPGFPSIVGSGPNSTILHYEYNRRLMENRDLLLMDIGAEYGNYSADITRTIPVNGTFTQEQRTIYQLVLDAQKAAIEVLRPGNGYIEGHMAAARVLVDGLEELGLITDPEAGWQQLFYILYPSSHFLGMDVHDVGDMGASFGEFLAATPQGHMKSRTLEAGMVLTIEPGLYFRSDAFDLAYRIFGETVDSAEIAAFIDAVRPVYEKYLDIGVRIEDDILITEDGNLNLSRYAPREIEDIEQLMAY